MLMQKTRIRTYKQMTKREILADSLLLLTALIWGCAFAVVKNALDSFPPGAIIAMRYLIAAAITGILFLYLMSQALVYGIYCVIQKKKTTAAM